MLCWGGRRRQRWGCPGRSIRRKVGFFGGRTWLLLLQTKGVLGPRLSWGGLIHIGAIG